MKKSSNEVWDFYLMQEDLNEICRKYGGKNAFSVDDAMSYMYVEFSPPRISADKSKLLFSATLRRNAAPQGSPLWLAAAVWIYDIATGESSIVYAQDGEAGIGRADWVGDDNSGICFVTFYDNNGGRDSINFFNVTQNELTIIFPYTDEHYNNVTLLPVGNNKISFTSSAKDAFFEESETILFDIPGNSYESQPVLYESITVLLENFVYVRCNEMAVVA